MRKRVPNAPVPPERELAGTWAAAGPDEALATTEGRRLRVLYPGRRNREAGPDFLDAVLATEAGEVRGAVEVHRRTSDWRRHGHGADPRYAGVVLHVVGRDDGGAGRAPGGAQLPLLELGAAPWPRDSPAPRPALPCAAAVAAGHDLVPALEAAGEARFAAAARRLQLVLEASPASRWEQLGYEAVAEALGYSRNGPAMRALAAAVPLDEVRARAAGGSAGPPPAEAVARQGDARQQPEGPAASAAPVEAEALMIGAAGLLPGQRHLPAGRRRGTYPETLERAWEGLGRPPALRAYHWETGHVRPENAPLRRALALARLAARWPAEGLLRRVKDCLAAAPAPVVASRRLAALVVVSCPTGYWARHWDFGVPAGGGSETAALVGPSRAADVVVNVLLPLAAAAGAVEGDTPLVGRAWEAYRAHGLLAENWITRLVRERTGLPAGRADRVASARGQQGLIAIYEGPCRDLRCQTCPLGTPA